MAQGIYFDLGGREVGTLGWLAVHAAAKGTVIQFYSISPQFYAKACCFPYREL